MRTPVLLTFLTGNTMTIAAALQQLLLCTCPQSSEIPDITAITCVEDLGELRKLIFQRTFLSAGVLNNIVIATDDPALQATWTALQGLATNAKVTVSPEFGNYQPSGGDQRTAGGGAQTPGGIPLNLGFNPTISTAELQRVPQDTIRDLKNYSCEVGLSVWLINEHGQIIGLKDATVAANFRGIPVAQFAVGDKVPGHYAGYDYNPMIWSFYPNWSDWLHVVTPTDFNALTQL